MAIVTQQQQHLCLQTGEITRVLEETFSSSAGLINPFSLNFPEHRLSLESAHRKQFPQKALQLQLTFNFNLLGPTGQLRLASWQSPGREGSDDLELRNGHCG
jgi:hypothetical protein